MSDDKHLRKLAETSSDPNELMDLATSTNVGIRYEVALNPNTPVEALNLLATDSAESVAKAANAWLRVRGQSAPEGTPAIDQTFTINNSSYSKKLGFHESDEIAGLQAWGVMSIVFGLLFFAIGLLIGIAQLNTYGGIPVPFFVLSLVGLVMINTGAFFVVLAKLGSGIAYRIGRHLAVRIPNEDLDSN